MNTIKSVRAGWIHGLAMACLWLAGRVPAPVFICYRAYRRVSSLQSRLAKTEVTVAKALEALSTV